MINGVNKLAITKLDVLDTLETVCICTAYELDGKVINEMPTSAADLARVKPVYEKHPGWCCSTAEARTFAELPENAQKYLKRIAELVDAEVAIVSVGPRRDQTFLV
jgi:adenylosuccinate synthase